MKIYRWPVKQKERSFTIGNGSKRRSITYHTVYEHLFLTVKVRPDTPILEAMMTESRTVIVFMIK